MGRPITTSTTTIMGFDENDNVVETASFVIDDDNNKNEHDDHDHDFSNSNHHPNNSSYLHKIRMGIGQIINSKLCQGFIFVLIVLNAIILGALTFLYDNPTATSILELCDYIMLIIFTLEIGCQIIYLGLLGFLQNGWNVFDFLIILFSWIFIESPLSIFRSFRIFRLMTVISRLKSQRRLFEAVGRTLPKLATIGLSLMLFFYVFAVLYTSLYHTLFENGYTDENYFGRLDLTFLTLFQFMILDDFANVSRQVSDAPTTSSAAWIGFVVWVCLTAFFVLNLVVAVICESLLDVQHKSFDNIEDNVLKKQKLLIQQETSKINKKQKALLDNQVVMATALKDILQQFKLQQPTQQQQQQPQQNQSHLQSINNIESNYSVDNDEEEETEYYSNDDDDIETPRLGTAIITTTTTTSSSAHIIVDNNQQQEEQEQFQRKPPPPPPPPQSRPRPRPPPRSLSVAVRALSQHIKEMDTICYTSSDDDFSLGIISQDDDDDYDNDDDYNDYEEEFFDASEFQNNEAAAAAADRKNKNNIIEYYSSSNGEERLYQLKRRLQNNNEGEGSGALDVKDRTYKLQTYENCFVASEVIDFFLLQKIVNSLKEGIALARLLEKKVDKLWYNVPLGCNNDYSNRRRRKKNRRKHKFKDEYMFYRFIPDDDDSDDNDNNEDRIPRGGISDLDNEKERLRIRQKGSDGPILKNVATAAAATATTTTTASSSGSGPREQQQQQRSSPDKPATGITSDPSKGRRRRPPTSSKDDTTRSPILSPRTTTTATDPSTKTDNMDQSIPGGVLIEEMEEEETAAKATSSSIYKGTTTTVSDIGRKNNPTTLNNGMFFGFNFLGITANDNNNDEKHSTTKYGVG